MSGQGAANAFTRHCSDRPWPHKVNRATPGHNIAGPDEKSRAKAATLAGGAGQRTLRETIWPISRRRRWSC